MKKIVIFDMDGTLLDTEAMYMKANQMAFHEFGRKFPKEDYLQFVGASEESVRLGFQKLLGDEELGNQLANRSSEIFIDLISHEAPDVKPRVRDLLNYLQSKQVECMVASSSKHEEVVDLMQRKGLSEYFTHYVGGDDVTEAKPQPDIFLKALEVSGYRPEDAIVIEDSLNGVRASYAAHIDVVMVPDLIAPDDEVFDKALAVVGHIWDVIPFID